MTVETASLNAKSILQQVEVKACSAAELVTLAKAQQEMIKSKDFESLVDVLQKRQELINRLLDGQLHGKEFDAIVNKQSSYLDDDSRNRMNALIEQISDSLAEVMRIDATDQETLEKELHEIGQELNTNSAAKTARQAYGKAGKTYQKHIPPRYTDKQV